MTHDCHDCDPPRRESSPSAPSPARTAEAEPEPELTGSQLAIAQECDALKAMLLAKNRAYGDSALNPVRIFSKASIEEQILVRLDDKVSRLTQGAAANGLDTEDVVADLLGYLILLRIAQKARKRIPGEKLRASLPIRPCRVCGEACLEPGSPDAALWLADGPYTVHAKCLCSQPVANGYCRLGVGHEPPCASPTAPCLHAVAGWRCTRSEGHEGPCAAIATLFLPPEYGL